MHSTMRRVHRGQSPGDEVRTDPLHRAEARLRPAWVDALGEETAPEEGTLFDERTLRDNSRTRWSDDRMVSEADRALSLAILTRGEQYSDHARTAKRRFSNRGTLG